MIYLETLAEHARIVLRGLGAQQLRGGGLVEQHVAHILLSLSIAPFLHLTEKK
jgi:hypothetical protein